MQLRSSFTPLLVTLLAACSSSPPPPAPAPSDSLQFAPVSSAAPPATEPAPPPEVKRSATEQLLERVVDSSACEDYDYHPRGGLQNLWCHRPQGFGLGSLRELSGVSVFVAGPHVNDTLDLTAEGSFGHYNPEFVAWLVANGPSERDSLARRATQASYDKHLAPLARVMWRTHQKLQDEPACMEREKKAYLAAIKRKKTNGYYERWYDFMGESFCHKSQRRDRLADPTIDGNVAKSVVGFWLRRSVDGTYDRFAQGLQNLITAYDPDTLAPPVGDASSTPAKSSVQAGKPSRSAQRAYDLLAQGKVVAARGVLQPLFDAGKASPADQAALRTVCTIQQDRACVDAIPADSLTGGSLGF